MGTENVVGQDVPSIDWLAELKAHAESKGYGFLIIDDGDYGEYFEEGLTPQEAFEEELDAAKQNC